MKQWFVRYGLVLALALGVSAPASAVSPGQPAPDFELPGMEQSIRLSALRGRLVYVDFWASWCAPCRLSFPWLNEMQTRYGPYGLIVIGVNVDAKRADADRFLKQVPAHFPIAFDVKGETPIRYQAKGMPTSFLVAPDGKVLFVHNGFRPEDKPQLENQIREALTRR